MVINAVVTGGENPLKSSDPELQQVSATAGTL